jgi:hypothetical protein
VGQSCLRLLNRLDDTVVEGQLRVRGLTDAQIGKLRDQIFAHARNNIASRIDARVKQTAARIGKLIRDPAQRSKLVAGLEKLKTEKERMGELAKLGITGETARRIARNPRKSEAELVRGLKATAANLEALHRECLMAMQDDKRALGLFAMTRKGTAELRKALNVPSNGSFAGNCVERGLAKAKNSKEAETLLKKFTMSVASIASGGVLACVVTSAAPALDKLGEASTKRKVAEAGAALGLTGRGTVEKARRAEKNAKLGVYVAVGTGLATGVGGNATYVKIGKKAFDKLSAKAAKEAAKHADKLAEQAQSLLEKAASVVTGAADRE